MQTCSKKWGTCAEKLYKIQHTYKILGGNVKKMMN
jgi:hypothetical protein